MIKTDKPNTVDEYIKGFPADIQKILKEVRTAIAKAAPEAEERIKYAMPTYVLNGNLIHFAAFKNHIGLYPAPAGTEAFKKDLSGYAGGKGSIQFPLDKPMPFDLITKIVKFRVAQNVSKEAKKKAKKK